MISSANLRHIAKKIRSTKLHEKVFVSSGGCLFATKMTFLAFMFNFIEKEKNWLKYNCLLIYSKNNNHI